MGITEILGISAGIIQVIGYYFYSKQVIKNTSTPNSVSWTLWTFGTVVNLYSFASISHDWVKTFLPTVSTIAFLITYAIALSKGKFSWPKKIDLISFFVGLFALVIWWQYNSAAWSNVILQASVSISFIPTFRGVLKNPNIEKPIPWFLWGSAYVVSFITICLRWNNEPLELVYPINCFFLHSAVGVLSLRKTINQKSPK